MRYLTLLLACSILVLFGCEKDATISLEELGSLRLDHHLEMHSQEHIAFEAFGCVGNHPNFQLDNGRDAIQAFILSPSNANTFRYYETDSLRFKDSLETYTQIDIPFEGFGDGLFMQASLNQVQRDRYARMTYLANDSLYVTPAIAVRSATLTTSDLGEIESGVNEQGYYEINWRSVPGADQYLLILRDRSGDALVGLTTERSSFQWYDLRSVSNDFFPGLRDPRLVEGAEYECSIYALTERAWLSSFGRHTFTYTTE
ncbi:MAG: hypothetical protein RLP15_03155 [Cryomorphaceae bacterium]